MTSILLAGATGMVGALALERLLRDDRVGHVVAPTRRLLAPHPKLSNPLVDRISLPHDAEWWAVDGAICAIETTRAKTATAEAYRAIDHDYPLALAKRLRSAGARRFAIVTSMGANARSWFRYTRTKGQLEDAISHLGFPSLTIVRPGFLAGPRDEHRTLEREIRLVLRLAAPILPVAARASPASTVADRLVEGALEGTAGRHIVDASAIATAYPHPGK